MNPDNPDKYQNKYRIDSARLKGWDYSNSGDYYITICTHLKEHFFGEIKKSNMHLSNIGVIAYILWYEIKNHYPKGLIEFGEFVVMPNHIHGVLTLNNDESFLKIDTVETRHASSLQNNADKPIDNKIISPKPNSISSIIGNYKSAVTKYARHLGHIDFAWQTRFYDQIIRDKVSYMNISNYILNNVNNWSEDEFFKI